MNDSAGQAAVSAGASAARTEGEEVPELPEVETIRRDLLSRVVGRTFSRVRVLPGAERIVQQPSPAEFARALSGQRIDRKSVV